MKQHPAESNKKKSQASLIVVVVLIVIAIAGVVILNSMVVNVIKSPPTTSCINYMQSSIDKACYLNENEIKIVVNRDIQSPLIEIIGFVFLSSNSRWELNGKRCTDARIEGNDYNDYCRILLAGERIPYILSTAGIEKQEKVTVYFSVDKVKCEIGTKDIEASC